VAGIALSAKSDLKLLAASSRRAGDSGQSAVQKYRLGVTHDNNESFRAAIDAYKAYVKAVSASSAPEARAHACLGLNAVGIAAHCMGDHRLALAYHAEHAKAAPDVRNRALALCNAGVAHRLLGSLPDSDACFTQALAMAQEAEDGPMSVLAAGHVGINATLCPPADAPPAAAPVGPQARAARALPPAGLRPAAVALGRGGARPGAGAPRRRRKASAEAPRAPAPPPSESALRDATPASRRIPRALAESAAGPRSGLPPSSGVTVTSAPLSLASATGRGLGVGRAPAAMTITPRRRAEDRAAEEAAGAARAQAAAEAGPEPAIATQSSRAEAAAAVRERAEEAARSAWAAKAAEIDARLETGEAALTEAAGMLTSSDDPRNGSAILAGLGAVAAARGRFEEAEQRFAAASAEAAGVDSSASDLFACYAAAAAAEGLLAEAVGRRAQEAAEGVAAEAQAARYRELWGRQRRARREGAEVPGDETAGEVMVVRATTREEGAAEGAGGDGEEAETAEGEESKA